MQGLMTLVELVVYRPLARVSEGGRGTREGGSKLHTKSRC